MTATVLELADLDVVVMKIVFTRVFVLRIWLGVRLLRLSMWVIGGKVEVAGE